MAPRLTADDVRRIAALAHLELSDAEVELFAGQLSGVLAYASEVQQIDTSGVEPMAHVLGVVHDGRADALEPSLERRQAMANAPDADADAGLFRVPKVL